MPDICSTDASAMRLMAFYVHLGQFSRSVVGKIDARIETIDGGRWIRPPLAPIAPAVARVA